MDLMSQLPLFVYGTLRRGEANHHYLAGRYDRWLAGTLRDFVRVTGADGFFVVSPAVGQQAAGELYFIRSELFAETLRECDILEDLAPGQSAGPVYRRSQVVVETAEGHVGAWAYIDCRSAR